MVIQLLDEVLSVLRHFPLASTLYILPYKSYKLTKPSPFPFWKEYILRFLKTPPFKNLKNKLGLQIGARIVRQEHKIGDFERMKMTKSHKSNAKGQTKCQQIAMETDGSCKATYNSMCK